MCQAGQYLAQNDLKCQLLANFGCFGPKSYFFGEGSKTIVSHVSENCFGTLFALFFDEKNVHFCPIFFLYLGSKVKNSYHQYTQGYNFPIGPTWK